MERTEVFWEQKSKYFDYVDELTGKQAYECKEYSTGDAMQWLAMEIGAYFANLLVVVLTLLIYYLPIIGEDMLKQKEIAEDIYENIQKINEAQ